MKDGIPALGRRGEGWVAAQIALAAAVISAGSSAGEAWAGPVRPATTVIGSALFVGGGALMAAGALGLGAARSAFPRPREGGALVESGVYARVRHPIYTGMGAGAVGWGLLKASPLALALAVVLAVVLDLKARREEAWLAETYPGYEAYRTRTHRFIPGLY